MTPPEPVRHPRNAPRTSNSSLAANNDILSGAAFEMQIVDLTRERDDALRRASCRNRHIEAAPLLIAALVRSRCGEQRTEACQKMHEPFQAPSLYLKCPSLERFFYLH